MKFVKETSPYIHKKSDVKKMMIDCLIALFPLVIFSIIQYGFTAIKIISISTFVMVFCEVFSIFLSIEKAPFKEKLQKTKEKATINNILTPVISAIIFSLIVPTKISVYVIIMGSIFGIVIGKLVYGGLGSNIFNPACLGMVFVSVCFGESLGYVTPNITSSIDVFVSGTPLGVALTEITSTHILDLFLGLVKGSMGEVNKVLIIISCIYLFIRKSIDIRITLSFLITFILVMFVSSFKLNYNPFIFVSYHLFTGGILFGCVFMLTDPITTPVTRPGRVTLGVISALIVVVIRLFGAYNEGMAFSILICNMLVPLLDNYKWATNKYSYKHFILWFSMIFIIILIILLGLKEVV